MLGYSVKIRILLISVIFFSANGQIHAQEPPGRYCQSIVLDGPTLPSTMPFSFQFNIPANTVYNMGYNVYYENSAPGNNNISIAIVSDGVFLLDQFPLIAGSGSYINNSLIFPSGANIIIQFTIRNGIPPSTTINVFEFQICSSFNYGGGGGGSATNFMPLDSVPMPPNGIFTPFLYAIAEFVFVMSILMLLQNLEILAVNNV